MNKLIILGCGGHARSAVDIALLLKFDDICFVDANARDNEVILDYPVYPDFSLLNLAEWNVFPAVGDNKKRQNQFETANRLGLNIVSLISPIATIGAKSQVGKGCFVGHHAYIGICSKIENGCIINTSAVIEHDAIIEQFTHISVNTVVAGNSKVGSFCMVGAGATIIDRIEIPCNTVIGAGAVVHRSINESGVYVGIPIRRIS